MLVSVARELGAALVVATHDAIVADRLEQVWQMQDGRLACTPATPGIDPREESCPA
jgi:predicted ABC-type transport system involved in lysophospholipase L1 biosynthesis ATPase subunit